MTETHKVIGADIVRSEMNIKIVPKVVGQRKEEIKIYGKFRPFAPLG